MKVTVKKRTSDPDHARTNSVIIDMEREDFKPISLPPTHAIELANRLGKAVCSLCVDGQPDSMADLCKVCEEYLRFRPIG